MHVNSTRSVPTSSSASESIKVTASGPATCWPGPGLHFWLIIIVSCHLVDSRKPPPSSPLCPPDPNHLIAGRNLSKKVLLKIGTLLKRWFERRSACIRFIVPFHDRVLLRSRLITLGSCVFVALWRRLNYDRSTSSSGQQLGGNEAT